MKKLLIVFAFFCSGLLNPSISFAQGGVPISWPPQPDFSHCCPISFDEISYCARGINGELYYKKITWAMSPGTAEFDQPDLVTGGGAHANPIEYVTIAGVTVGVGDCKCFNINGCCYTIELTGGPGATIAVNCFDCTNWNNYCHHGSTGVNCK